MQNVKTKGNSSIVLVFCKSEEGNDRILLDYYYKNSCSVILEISYCIPEFIKVCSICCEDEITRKTYFVRWAIFLWPSLDWCALINSSLICKQRQMCQHVLSFTFSSKTVNPICGFVSVTDTYWKQIPFRYANVSKNIGICFQTHVFV